MPRVDASRLLILAIFLIVSSVLYLQISRQCPNYDPKKLGAPPKIAMISMTTRETSYDHIALANKYDYAQRHGYSMVFDYKGPKGVWDKLTNVERLIKENKYDWIWWLDYDVLITNHTIKVEDVIDDALSRAKNPNNIDMIVTPDCFPLNAGSMIFRSTPWVIDFFKGVWECGDTEHADHHYSEQDCMRDMIHDNTRQAGDKSIYTKQWKMNAFPEEIGCYDEDKKKWERGMFALHFAGAWAHVKNTDDPVGDLMRKYHPQVVY